MSSSYQKVTLVGRLGRDPELKYLDNGTAVATFTMAVDTGWGDNSVTIWPRVTCWRKLAENVAQYTKKGSLVLVEGELTPDKSTGGPRVWQGRDNVAKASYEITARDVRFLSSPSGGGNDGEQQQEPKSDDSYDPDELMF